MDASLPSTQDSRRCRLARGGRAALLLLASAGGTGQPGADETVTVHGNRSRFVPAPMAVPDPRFDPPGRIGALHDTDTGTDLSAFGPAYLGSTPAPPINPALRDPAQSGPVQVGPPR